MPYPVVLRRPPRAGVVLPRPRLVTTGVARVLAGPSGYGKTTAALEAAAGRRLVWTRLAEGYGLPQDLVGIALASVGRESEEPSGHDADLLDRLFALLDEAPTTLIVDEYEHGTAYAIDPFISEVISYAPDGTTVVITTSQRPAGLVGRVPSGLVDVHGPADLAFTVSETVALFALHGRRDADAISWWEIAAGRPDVVAWAAASGVSPERGLEHLVERVHAALTPAERDLVLALALVPYLTADLAAAAGLGGAADLAGLAGRAPFVQAGQGVWQVDALAARELLALADTGQVRVWRGRLAGAFRAVDPAVAVDLLLDRGDTAEAAELLASAAGELPVDRALVWAYRLPADLRRMLPPALTAGRATVDIDLATAAAERRVAVATDDDTLGDACYALGSARLSAGELSGAAAAFERSTRLGRDEERSRRSWTWLGVTRWMLGDLEGAEAALAVAPDDLWTWWARALAALGRDDVASALGAGEACVAASARPGATEAPGRSVRALALLMAGDPGSADEAARADRAGASAGGLDLLWGAFAHACVLARRGDHDEALAVCERLTKVVHQEAHGRLLDAAVRRFVHRAKGDAELVARSDRRIADLRQRGFGPLLRICARLLPVEAGAGVFVDLLGTCRVSVDGVDVEGRWRSKKSTEVLLVLALAGARGARREEVIEAVWPGRDPSKGRTLLRTALAEIRRVLEPDRPGGSPSRYLRGDGDRLVLETGLDLRRAEADLAAGHVDSAFAALRPGLAHLDGTEEWADELRRRVDRLRVDAADAVVAADGTDLEEALAVLIEHEAWRREPYDRLARLYRERGDEAAARAVERRWFADET